MTSTKAARTQLQCGHCDTTSPGTGWQKSGGTIALARGRLFVHLRQEHKLRVAQAIVEVRQARAREI